MKNASLALLSVLALTACHHDKPAMMGPPQPPPPWLDGKVDDLAKLADPNAQRMGDFLRAVAYREDDRTDWQIPLDTSHCYVISGMGSETVERFSLYLWNPNDHRVADKTPHSPAALIQFCPQEPGLYRLEGKVPKGYGFYSVAVYRTEQAAKPAVVAPPPPAAPLDMEQVIVQQASAAAPGSERAGAFFDGHGESEWYASMEPGQCYWVIGAGDANVKKLSLYLWDPQGHRVTENRADTSSSMIGHCPTVGGMFKFSAKVESGSGQFKVGVYWKKR